ncbi:unnamed protein product [Heligmosomoides polygyrus]|uniref:Reverse transcriptase domain-containing protein n=1 Tax=Heligmosomoides polygyrus TaxID=6339 RepID=A0A183GTD0_HELPZ|nr:unnamed protein product [Heligmosomoides polygyrus]
MTGLGSSRTTITTIQLFDRKLKIPIGKGVRQGDTISPKLFTAALQDAMKDLNWDDKGYLVDGKRISNLRFADDIVLITIGTIKATSSTVNGSATFASPTILFSSLPARAEVEEMLNELNVAGMKIGLDMNMSKTQDGKRISNLRFADDIVLISTSTAKVEEQGEDWIGHEYVQNTIYGQPVV